MNPATKQQRTSTKYAPETPAPRPAKNTHPKTMNQYTSTEFEMQPASSKPFGYGMLLFRSLFGFDHVADHSRASPDESAADLSAYLDFSSYATHGPAAAHSLFPLSTDNDDSAHLVVIPSAEQPSGSAALPLSPRDGGSRMLRPVDDSLLDSPLDLELSPASTFESDSTFSSPFLVDWDGDFVPFGPPSSAGDSGSASSSPLLPGLEASTATTTTTTATVYPSLFAPAPTASSDGTAALQMSFGAGSLPALPGLGSGGDIDMAALASSLGVPLPPVMAAPPRASPSASPAPLPFIREEPEQEQEDVKPNADELASAVTAGHKKRKSDELSDDASASASSRAESAGPSNNKRDKFTGIRNTKKPPVAYDAPTLPKNYYTESATSKKRGGSRAAAKRARTGSVSASPAPAPAPADVEVSATETTPAPAAAVDLPLAQPEPMPEDEFDESQLSAIELKRRQNTLAARRSRARKSAYIQELKDEIDALKRANEGLRTQLEAGGGPEGGQKCAACGGGAA